MIKTNNPWVILIYIIHIYWAIYYSIIVYFHTNAWLRLEINHFQSIPKIHY